MHELLASKWFWWALAFALFAVEAVLPGVYMLWLGLAALATAVVVLVGPAMSVPAQWILFSVLSVAAVAAAWRFRGVRAPGQNEPPPSKRRGEQLLDRVFPLESGIIDGRGRVKIGDAFWAVEGPELPAGARVRIRAVEGALLRVDPA
jgi:inner membrane protein